MTVSTSSTSFIVTHNGSFHADEVVATAILRLCEIDYPVVRTRDEGTIMIASIVLDVGKVLDPSSGRFDHHQYRGGLATAGLVWEHYAPVEASVKAKVYQDLIADIDRIDTGDRRPAAGEFSFSHAISSFNLEDIMSSEQDEAFDMAVQFALQVLKNQIRIAQKWASDMVKVKAVIDALETECQIPVFDEYLQGMGESAKAAGCLRYVYPSGGTWRLQITEGAPALSEGLEAVDGVTFVHAARFIAGTTTAELAEALAGCH
jgi:uncharacterized UPF0160 family protein